MSESGVIVSDIFTSGNPRKSSGQSLCYYRGTKPTSSQFFTSFVISFPGPSFVEVGIWAIC